MARHEASGVGMVVENNDLRVLRWRRSIRNLVLMLAQWLLPTTARCCVLDESGEADLDLCDNELYIFITLKSKHDIKAVEIYQHAESQEYRGGDSSDTVQTVPHLVDVIVD
jgi:CTP synthase (UTP-ammonia lyase)